MLLEYHCGPPLVALKELKVTKATPEKHLQ